MDAGKSQRHLGEYLGGDKKCLRKGEYGFDRNL